MPKKILVIGPSWVGDMVMSQSLYITLKQQHPDAKLHVMAPAWCCALLERMPEVDKAIVMPLGHGDFKLTERFRIGRQLATEGYDRAIVQPNSMKSALIPLFAGIKKRTGWKGESRYGLLNDLRSNKTDFPLMVERYVALAHPKADMQNNHRIPALPWPALQVDTANQQNVLKELNLNAESPIVSLCPGAEFGPSKRWPEQHYAEVARHQIEQGKQIWIFGSAKDISVAETIKHHLPHSLQGKCHILAGKTSLHQAIDLMALSSVVISNDSGLMHIAAALKRPLVGIYGSTSPEYTPPLAEQVAVVHTDIECRPCFKRECPLGHLKCLKELPAGKVLAAIQQLTDPAHIAVSHR
ncbi:lipopolysaccharide heptosyltransferase II [Oceanisphaera psychrotolerans]|uniref:lipopolysaccharide heptosyltransferase II n=1 Tax=Oceanisphaera psychrotolerans TaxID=1414654 RepID=A0A1J4QGG3_9GAMM|nr:lipopolysaccharide heptosyltransferase II [Oceanisphaera psychrotolerans]OIN11101.1 lipopolysaccharide heptosyltransferase II [Oceanisphaera psychrotolerans]